ncbi:MAG TPA: response regulator [Gemmatimonadales bacterium]
MNKDELSRRLRATFIAELDEQLGALNAGLLALESSAADAEHLKVVFRVAHTLKGAARAAGVLPVEHLCHRLETLLAAARDDRIALGRAEFDALFAAADALAGAGVQLKAGEEVTGPALATSLASLGALEPTPPATPTPTPGGASVSAPAPAPAASEGNGYVRVPTERLDAMLLSAGDLLLSSGRVASRAAELETLLEVAHRGAVESRHANRAVRLALERSGAAPVAVQAVTGFEDHLRRLTQSVAQIARAAGDDARVITRATEDVLYHLRKLRMRPFGEACEALPRLVRDLARATEKDVELALQGGDVEADRVVLDAVREALLQLVRNAIDHGVESPKARVKAGKPRRGRVTVEAALEADRLVVSVSDDGAGLNVPAIKTQLERRGVTPTAGDAALVRLLLETGVSTREKATPISGRGVGLDVVRAAVARVHGTAEATWTVGEGTRFTLRCPATLASLRTLLVGVGPQTLAVPTAYVERLFRINPEQIKRVEGRSVLSWAEGPVPIVALARLLPPLIERPLEGPIPLVLLRAGGRRLAVAVDELIAEQECVVRPVGNGEDPIQHIGGAALLADGRIALVLDPITLVAAGLEADVGAGLTAGERRPGAPATRRVLVVDDSITTRTLEQSILEAAGYDVLTAVDGSDAWRALQERGADLVVADIEMPRMDGFALCEAIRGSKRFQQLPVVLVTALESPEHRARGLEVGADAYIGKSSFDQQHLLDTIRQLLD